MVAIDIHPWGEYNVEKRGRVDIAFATAKLEKQCNDSKAGVRAFGPKCAKKLRLRLDDMRAARNLEDCRHLPGRYHELTGDRKGQIAADVEHPKRLIFKPAHDPPPKKRDGGLDWNKVTAVIVLEIEDYHG